MATRLTYFPELLIGIRKPSTDAMLNAGTVTFYEAGTTTLKTVWNDAAGTSAADNPKTLSAYGTASVYGDGIYKLVIKDSAGNTVYTWDNYKIRYYNVSVLSKSADYGASSNDDLILVDTSGGDVTITLPQSNTAATPLYVKKTSSDANSVVVAAYAGDLVDGAASVSFSAEGYTAAYFSDGSSNWYGSADTTDASTLGGYSPAQTPAASKLVVSQSGSTFIHDDWIDWATKAGAGLAFSASDPTSGVLSINAGDGLEFSADNLQVKVDGTTIEIASDTVGVKAGGIGYTQLSAAALSGVSKFWAVVDGSGTTELLDSYNVTSVTDNGTGTTTITIATDFGSANWCAQANVLGEELTVADYGLEGIRVSAQTAGTIQVMTYHEDGAGGSALVDRNKFYVSGDGDQ